MEKKRVDSTFYPKIIRHGTFHVLERSREQMASFETFQDQEMARQYLPLLAEVKPDISREYTISDLLHKLDPSARMDPLAESLLLDIADDFIDSVISMAADRSKGRDDKSLKSEDVLNVVQMKFGDVLPTGDMSGSRPQRTFLPSDVHQRRLNTIQSLALVSDDPQRA